MLLFQTKNEHHSGVFMTPLAELSAALAFLSSASASPGGGNIIPNLPLCFHAFSYEQEDCTLSPSDTWVIPSNAGIIYEGKLVHLINENSGACAEGIMVQAAPPNPAGDLSVEFTSNLGGCLGAEGLNKYCSGPCPNPPGIQACYDPVPLSDYYTCTDLTPLSDGTPRAAFSVDDFPCLYGIYNDDLTFMNEAGSCYTASCSGDDTSSTETIVGATCADLQGNLETCWGRSCASRTNNNNRHRDLLMGSDTDAITSTTASGSSSLQDSMVQPEDSIYQEYANKCANTEYDVYLYVDHHFYAIAIPSNRKPKKQQQQQQDSDGAGGDASSAVSVCPTVMVQAEFQDPQDDTPYTKVLSIASGNPRDANYHLAANPTADKLYIGTFALEELRQAFESVDPTSASHNKGPYEIIAHNCADLMLSLSSALHIPVHTAPITSYVTRRLLQAAASAGGNGMMNLIRNSVHYSSFFGTSGNSETTHDNSPQRLLRRSSTSTSTTTEQEPSDEQVIKTLVQARVTSNNLV